MSDLKAKRTWLIDVRTPAEYLKKFSIAGTVNVPWTEFYAKDGRPNPRIRATLSKVGIEADDRPGDDQPARRPRRRGGVRVDGARLSDRAGHAALNARTNPGVTAG